MLSLFRALSAAIRAAVGWGKLIRTGSVAASIASASKSTARSGVMRTVPVASTPQRHIGRHELFFRNSATARHLWRDRSPESTGRESKAEMIGRDRDAATFAIGDRLKITLFENLRPERAGESALASLVDATRDSR